MRLYKLSYTYDALNHLTSRTGYLWSAPSESNSPLPAGSLSPVMLNYGDYSYAMTAIHETFHLAGENGGYNDEHMARAVKDMLPGLPGLPKDGADAFEWSGYWNTVLKAKCPEKRK